MRLAFVRPLLGPALSPLGFFVCALSLGAVRAYAQGEPMEHVAVGDRLVAYHVVGDGPGTPMLVITGGPGIDHQYAHLSGLWPRFGKQRRVVFFDQPGTGQSSPVGTDDSLTVSDVVEAIEAIRARLGVDRFDVLGHSGGGYLGVAYATRHPARVERLALVSPIPPRASDLEFNFARNFPDSLARGADWRFDDPAALEVDLRRHVAMSFVSSRMREWAMATLGPIPFYYDEFVQLMRDEHANDLSDAAARLPMPVLVGTGRFDGNVTPRGTWAVHKLIPGSRFVVWEDSGHYPMVEEPEAFFRVVEGFWEGE